MKLIIFTLYFSGGTIPLYLVVKGTHLLDTMWSLIIPNVVWTMELIIMISFFKSIPPSLYEAAELDGAGEFQTFVKVALPLSKASIASIALFFFIGHWNSYYNPMLYLNEPSKYPMQLVLRNMLLENTESVTSSMLAGVAPEGIKSAIIVLTMIPVLIIYPFVQKFFVKVSPLALSRGNSMVRLAILGALSSHADAFCRFASERDDVELVGFSAKICCGQLTCAKLSV